MALQEPSDNGRAGQHHCRDCGLFFESGKSLEVHLQYHKENLLNQWANQAAATANSTGDSENNNVKRREFQTAPADSTVLPTGPGRPNSTTGYPGSSSPFPHPQTPQSYASAPSPYQSDAPSNPGPSPSSTSYGYSNSSEPYSVPYNGYNRSPRSHPGFYQDQQQEGYVLGQPPQENASHSPTSSSGFRYYNKNCYPLDKNGVSSSSPNTCDKCGCVCESVSILKDHIKANHSSYGHVSAFQAPENFYKQEPPAQHDQGPDILDLDCQQKFRPPEEDSGSLPPVNNPHSVSAMLNPWPASKFPPYQVTSTNPPPQPPYQNGSPYPQESFSPPNVPTNPPIPNATSPKPVPAVGGQGKGDSWKSNEARRPKTYNCSACNKWFTSSGHLKRHYNTTLHKNAVKQNGGVDPATLPISSHHHPNRDPSYIHSSKTPPGAQNPQPNLNTSVPKAKKAKSVSPQGDGHSSPGLSGTEGDSSRSNFGNYEITQPATHPPFDNGFAPTTAAAPTPDQYEYYRLQPQQNSTNQMAAQPPNYQAGLSVSPSGGLPIIYPPSLHTLPTPNHLTFMGENIMMPVESGQQFQVLDHHTTQLYTNSLIVTGSSVRGPLPSFSQLMPEANFVTRQDFYAQSEEETYYKQDLVKVEPTTTVVIKQEIMMEEYAQSESPEEPPQHYELMPIVDVKIDYQPVEDSLKDATPPSSPIEFPTSTNVELEAPVKPPRKRRKKSEVSSNQVTSTGSPKPLIRCDECDKSFNRICYLTQHNKCFHSGAKPFKCERCGKRFHSEARARDHERKHGGVKPYRCEICPKSFNHKTDLRRHLCLHTGTKPFACTACGKGFIRKDHMLKHLDTHSNSKRRYLPQGEGLPAKLAQAELKN